LAGQAHAPALQTRPLAAQSVAGCQVRHADPAMEGRQRTICCPVPSHWTASRVGQAFAGGQVQAVAPPDSAQDFPGSLQAVEDAAYQQPSAFEVSWAQVTTSPPAAQ
jgi:hypothetical protein